MNVLHGRLEALEKVGAGALADQALLKLVRLHLLWFNGNGHLEKRETMSGGGV
jgi:hypothetical protein